MVSTFYFCALALCVTADGTRVDWNHDRPRIVAVRADSGLYKHQVCITFPEGDRIQYRAADICPDYNPKTGKGCKRNQIDILVRSPSRAILLGVVRVDVDKGECK